MSALARPYEERDGLCECGCGEPTPLAKRSDTAKGWVKGQPLRYCYGHRGAGGPLWDVDPATGCWELARHRDRNNYGRWSNSVGASSLAHRRVYEKLRGPIPDGLQLDHLCRNPCCVNPDHLEPVTNAENSRRGRRTRLTPEDVAEIRASSERSNKAIARQYGIHPVYVWQIRAGRKWVAT